MDRRPGFPAFVASSCPEANAAARSIRRGRVTRGSRASLGETAKGRAGSDRDVHQKDDGATVLHLVAAAGTADEIATRLEQGDDVNARTRDGSTPLHWAAKYEADLVRDLAGAIRR